MAKSLAFWLKGSKSHDISDTSIELHFNYWHLNSSSKHEINYLDIGAKFKGLKDIQSINFFLPFRVENENYIHDIGQRLIDNRKLIQAIFNARPISLSESESIPNTLDINFSDNNDDKLRLFCQINPLPLNNSDTNGVKFKYEEDGTIITFPSELFNFSDDSYLGYGYFRFRIILRPEDKKCISQTYIPKDSKLLSHFESTEIVDFRLNEIRDLPQPIASYLSNPICISTVHFFLIRETNSELKLSHTEFKRCRILEKKLWDIYLKGANFEEKYFTPDHMLIYHWSESKKPDKPKEQDKLEDSNKSAQFLNKFSAFAKFSTTTVTHKTLLEFLFYFVLLGIVSGYLANCVYSFPMPSTSIRLFVGGTCFGMLLLVLINVVFPMHKPEPNRGHSTKVVIILCALSLLIGAILAPITVNTDIFTAIRFDQFAEKMSKHVQPSNSLGDDKSSTR